MVNRVACALQLVRNLAGRARTRPAPPSARLVDWHSGGKLAPAQWAPNQIAPCRSNT